MVNKDDHYSSSHIVVLATAAASVQRVGERASIAAAAAAVGSWCWRRTKMRSTGKQMGENKWAERAATTSAKRRLSTADEGGLGVEQAGQVGRHRRQKEA